MTTQALPATLVSLDKQNYISLTTFRRTGVPVATPVWFVRLEDTVYVYSDATAGKVKRIRANPQVQLAVCTLRGRVTGPTIPGEARIVTDPQEAERAKTALDAKYWIPRHLLALLYRTMRLFQGRKQPTPIVYLAVTLAPAPPQQV